MELNDKIPILHEPICTDITGLELSTFTWGDALIQRDWNFHVYPNEQQKINIMLCAGRLTLIQRALFPIINIELEIVSWLRCRQYNTFIGGARESMHVDGAAVDFKVKGAKSYVIRERLKSELQRLDIRMEMLPDNAEWVHVDLRKPNNGVRYFKP